MRIVAEDSTITFCFNTKRFSSGAPFTLAGSPSMYARVDGNATEITAGFTLTADFDSKTGLNKVVLDLSADAGYTAGSLVEVFIAAGTVDSVSVADTKVYEFEIGNTGSQQQANTRVMLALPAVAPASNGGLGTVDASNVIKANMVAISDDSVAADRFETMLDGTGGNSLTIDDLIVGGSVSIAENLTVTGDFQMDNWFVNTSAQINSMIVFTNAISWNSSWDAEVQSECNDALVALGLDHLVSTSVAGADVADNSIIAKMVSKSATADWDSFVNTTDALEAIRDAITAGAITPADVWTYATRVLTAATNITSTGGTTVPQTGDTYALANGASGFVALKAVVDAILLDTGTDGVAISSTTRDAIATSLLDLVAGVETNRTVRAALRLILAAAAGKLSGAATPNVLIRDTNDTVNRIDATVDADGNRTAVSYNTT